MRQGRNRDQPIAHGYRPCVGATWQGCASFISSVRLQIRLCSAYYSPTLPSNICFLPCRCHLYNVTAFPFRKCMAADVFLASTKSSNGYEEYPGEEFTPGNQPRIPKKYQESKLHKATETSRSHMITRYALRMYTTGASNQSWASPKLGHLLRVFQLFHPPRSWHLLLLLLLRWCSRCERASPWYYLSPLVYQIALAFPTPETISANVWKEFMLASEVLLFV